MSFPVQSNEHFLTVARYVERNAYAAQLCLRPEQWAFRSLYHWTQRTMAWRMRLSSWPIRRCLDWVEHLAMDVSTTERQQTDWSARQEVPFGDEAWVESVARKFDLETIMRPRGRPKKSRPAEQNPKA